MLLTFTAASAQARDQDDPPGRVGRVAAVAGSVSWWDHQAGQWSAAERNLPLTTGDRISTAANGRAELRVGSTVLRVAAGSELEVLRLDDERMSFQLHGGGLALRVRSREVADEIELVTAEARMRPQRAGHYRLDRIDDTTWAASWRGELRIDDASALIIGAGQRAELFREGRRGLLRHAWVAPVDDAFSQWALQDDRRDERSASSQYVSPEMTGVEDLDRNGRWDLHPEYGAVWLPHQVRDGWAPYRYGRWAWVRPWGWTWVDEAPWGFAPFHYGRWVHWRNDWGWVPGPYVPRPVFAPALVAWVGGSHWSLSAQVGGPPVGWVPLSPYEAFLPHYRATPVYVERINVPPRHGWRGQTWQQVPTGPVVYGNQGVPNAVTVVPRDVLARRQPVDRALLDLRGSGSMGPQQVLPQGARIGPGSQGPQQPAQALTAVLPPPGPVSAELSNGASMGPPQGEPARRFRPQAEAPLQPQSPRVQPPPQQQPQLQQWPQQQQVTPAEMRPVPQVTPREVRPAPQPGASQFERRVDPRRDFETARERPGPPTSVAPAPPAMPAQRLAPVVSSPPAPAVAPPAAAMGPPTPSAAAPRPVQVAPQSQAPARPAEQAQPQTPPQREQREQRDDERRQGLGTSPRMQER